MGGPKNAFLEAKISPRGSKRLPKIKQNCVLAENLILLDAFLTIVVPVPFHDAFFVDFFTNFYNFSITFLRCSETKIKKWKHAFGYVFYDIISRSGKSNHHKNRCKNCPKNEGLQRYPEISLWEPLRRPKTQEIWRRSSRKITNLPKNTFFQAVIFHASSRASEKCIYRVVKVFRPRLSRI